PDTVAIPCTDTHATLPSNYALVVGPEYLAVPLKISGARTVTATDAAEGSQAANTSSSITVSVGAFVKLQLLVPGETAAAGTAAGKTGTPTAQSAGVAFNVTVNAVDTNWNLAKLITHNLG